MKLLIDTHIFLYVLFSPGKISKRAKKILLDPEFTKYISAVTFWEISLKYQLGKIDLTDILPDALPAVAKDTGFEILKLDEESTSTFYKLPRLKNKDPFDRMLAWQAIRNDCYLLTQDRDFTDYKDCGLKIA